MDVKKYPSLNHILINETWCNGKGNGVTIDKEEHARPLLHFLAVLLNREENENRHTRRRRSG